MTEELRIRNYSERTVQSYITSISQLSVFYKTTPDKISRDQVKDYAYHLIYSKDACNSRINQLISAWKIFQVDVLGNSWEEFGLKRPRREKKIPVVLSRGEALSLIGSLPNIKHRMILTVTYVTGMRRAEVLNLKLKDIDSSRGVVRIINGKGNKSREVPVPKVLIGQLRDYYKYYRPETYLFEGTRGKPYSASSMDKVIKRAASKAGIKKEVSPHILRHSFATHMLDKGINLKRLQMILGHSALRTTSIYLHLSDPNPGDLPDLLTPKE
ncbi:MAG: tyrosine-type recombinase/integrase [Bacteroidales bacterium]|nr:tyrosine-type recombinase/integrase [Bacteroidales bacterium]